MTLHLNFLAFSVKYDPKTPAIKWISKKIIFGMTFLKNFYFH